MMSAETASRVSRPRFAGCSSRTLAGFAFAAPGAIILVALIAYPVVDAIRLSFNEVQILSGTDRFVGFDNYAAIFNDPDFFPALLNTAIWSVGSLAGQFLLGLIAALAINERLPGVALVRSVLLLPYVVPVITLALFWRWMLDGTYGIVSYTLQHWGLLPVNQSPLALPSGAMISVILANVWRSFPFVMIVYWAALQGIPQEQYEAAKVDGANTLQQFWYVTLPNLRDATITLVVLRVIWTVTYFDLIWLLTRGGPAGATKHWPIWIYEQAMGSLRFGYAAALATLMGAFLMLTAFLYLRTTHEKEVR
jgi:multiple sugar transport system permease protein